MSSDGTHLISNQSNVVKIWQIDSVILKQDMAHYHTEKVNDLTFSIDGQLLVSGSSDKTVKIWDTSIEQCLTTFCSHQSSVINANLSPDLTLCTFYG
jgi:WD40 repeat protein